MREQLQSKNSNESLQIAELGIQTCVGVLIIYKTDFKVLSTEITSKNLKYF